MAKNKALVTWGVILGVLVIGFLVISQDSSAEEHIELAKCITDSGTKFYGAYWCPHCNTQKQLFKSAVKYIPYVECAKPNDQNGQSIACQEAGITNYPTWIFPDGSSVTGVVPLEELASRTGC